MAHLTNFSFEFFMKFSQKMLLFFFYTMVQKKETKLKSRGPAGRTLSLETISVIFGRSSLIFCPKALGIHVQEKGHDYCAHAEWCSPWRHKKDTSLRRIKVSDESPWRETVFTERKSSKKKSKSTIIAITFFHFCPRT